MLRAKLAETMGLGLKRPVGTHILFKRGLYRWGRLLSIIETDDF